MRQDSRLAIADSVGVADWFGAAPEPSHLVVRVWTSERISQAGLEAPAGSL
jgi:hypothetical protein